MAEPPRSLPLNLEISLHVLERGHFLRHGGDLPSADLPGRVFQFLEMLEKDGLDWALVGAAALNLHHGRPRATVDLDIVVRPEDVPRMRKLLEEGCAHVDGDAERLQGTLSPAPMLLTIDVFQSGAHPFSRKRSRGRSGSALSGYRGSRSCWR